jgi:C_GCAxxG_C_C family probable redox protein
MERREFLKSSLKMGAVIVAGSALVNSPASAVQKAATPMDPDSVAEAALKHFLPGKKTCVESMLLAGADALGIESPLIPDIGLGIAGGVGLQGRTCGAILGAAMVASILMGQKESDYDKKKKAALGAAAKIFNEFEKKHGTTDCRKLTGLDLTTPEGKAKLKASVKQETCSQFVDTGARLLAEILANA